MNLNPQSIQPPSIVSNIDPDDNGVARGGYDSVFWLTYLANSFLMVAVAVLFRYADFVTVAGGTSLHLGLIVGVGTIGALAMRIFQGVGIDRFGPRIIWLLSLALFSLSMVAHVWIDSVHGVAVYVARTMLMTSLAGAFGASITYISLRVPYRRMAEMIGTLGTSGFIGIALGPLVGDILFGTGEVSRVHVQRMFWLAATMGAASFVLATLATRGQIRRIVKRQPPAIPLIRRYHPGFMLVAAVAVGWGVGVSGTFLRPYADGIGITGIKTFFIVYAVSAFIVRIATRRLPERIGHRPLILWGFGSLALSMLLYLVVHSEWLLAVPAIAAGAGHACLFPSVTAGGCARFPSRYRGLATTLMMAMYDVGSLVGQPVIGGIVEFAGRQGLPPYATMFVCMSAILGTFNIAFFFATRQSKQNAGQPIPNVQVASSRKRQSRKRRLDAAATTDRQ